MAFLYSLVSGINKADKSLIYIAAIMMCSYTFSDLLPILNNIYLDWILYDLLTITILIAAIFTSYVLTSTASNYIILGLFVNACLTIAIYYDLYVLNNIDEWWLWSVYSIGVNVIDLLMIAVLFINKDFLGLIELKRFIFNRSVLQQNQIDH
ncbi:MULTISPECIES: hypothetical protein [Pseudoalteromonas]|uniref:Membrane protein n=1 Tax=Pseudoalteromonas translucida (strain TAC 125) TaxID=326442 RepID=Q3IHU2_PSET1|nr:MULTISPECIES: hypothetical protein [Pseudoalteromonas]CAI87340.1 putative membrane protein [Pseudoalteromonas translucida]